MITSNTRVVGLRMARATVAGTLERTRHIFQQINPSKSQLSVQRHSTSVSNTLTCAEHIQGKGDHEEVANPHADRCGYRVVSGLRL